MLSRIGQIAVNARDLDRAVAFYRDKVGLPFLFQVPNMAFFDDTEGNTMALMSEVPK